MNKQATTRTKFKYTRELIKIALDDGMTQAEIARICRTVQSTVSSWANGKSKALEKQLTPLLERYGHRLNRATFRVYRVEHPPEGSFDDSEEGRLWRVLWEQEASREDRAAALEGLASALDVTTGTLEQALPRADAERVREGWRWRASSRVVTRVDGPVILQHTFERLHEVRRGKYALHEQWEPCRRWHIHRLTGGRFALVEQDLALAPFGAWAQRAVGWHRVSRGDEEVPTSIRCTSDGGRWTARVHQVEDVPSLLALCDRLAGEGNDPHAAATAPFLVRKALLEHGYDVADVDHIV